MMPRLRAAEELRAGGVADGRVYGLVMDATGGDEAAAAAALQARIADRLRRNEKPEV